MSEQAPQPPDRFIVYAMPAGHVSLYPSRVWPGEPVSLELERYALDRISQGNSYNHVADSLGVGMPVVAAGLRRAQAFFGAKTLAQTACMAIESGTIYTPHSTHFSRLRLGDAALTAANLARNGYDGSPESVEETGVDPFDAFRMYQELFARTHSSGDLLRAMHTLYANEIFDVPSQFSRPVVLFRAVGAETLPSGAFGVLNEEIRVFRQEVLRAQTVGNISLSPEWFDRNVQYLYGVAQGYNDQDIKDRFRIRASKVESLAARVAQLLGTEDHRLAVQEGFRIGVFGALPPVSLEAWRENLTRIPATWF